VISTVQKLRRLNIGCGGRFHPAWLNVDLHPQHASVRRHDVVTTLPFVDRSFDAVYHAHLLEHLPRECALPFLLECFRVLEPGGVLRVVVPDLEQIAELYLATLDAAWEGDAEAQRRHMWAVLEMYDQVVRERPGGAMLSYLADDPADIAWHRLGADAATIQRHLTLATADPLTPGPSPPSTRERGAKACPSLLGRVRLLMRGGWRERLIRWLLGHEYDLLQRARFRQGGEVHRWMYDRQSLRELMTAAGFIAFRLTTAGESGIPGWADDHLDTQPDGTPAKPDSLYAEAVRP
jgi:predicted SAM-dependent methyltransferase